MLQARYAPTLTGSKPPRPMVPAARAKKPKTNRIELDRVDGKSSEDAQPAAAAAPTAASVGLRV
jgi:hypothetical protein